MKKIILFAFCLFSFVQAQQPGDLVSSELKLDISPGGLIQWIGENCENEIDQDLMDFVENVPLGLQAYKLTYKSQDYDDNLVNATGLILFPKTNKKLSTVLFMAPTTDNRDFVASNLSGTNKVGILLPIAISMAEYIVVAPDYLGMGDGDGTLPYIEDKTAASAGLDMLTAANQFLTQQGKPHYDEYFVGGYSQGGHAAMSVVKYNQAQGNRFPVRYLASGAGPYDMSNTTMQEGLFNEETYPNSAFVAYVINTCHDIGFQQYENDWHEIISDEYYDQFVASALNEEGGLSWGPEVWRELFQPDFVSALEADYNHPTRQCLRSNDVFDFNNTTPTTMFSSWLDKTIPPENDQVAQDAQRAYYSWWNLDQYKINKSGLGPWNHGIGAVPYTLAAIYKFNTQRIGGFFNLWAEYTGEYGRWVEEGMDLAFVQSSVAPEVVGASAALSQKQMKSTGFEAVQDLTQIKEKVSLVKVNLANGAQKVFPLLKEEAVVLDAKDILGFHKQNMTVDMSNWSGEIKELHFLNQNEIIYNLQNKANKHAFDFELKMLPSFDAIEIIADAAIFMVKVPEQNIQLESNIFALDNGIKAQVVAEKSIEEIQVFDTTGYVVKKILAKGKQQVEFDLPKGMYVLKTIYDDGSVENIKFMKK